MNFSGSRARLNALTRDLAVRWQDTRATWSDERSKDFERRFLNPLFDAVDKAGSALEQLDAISAKARRDCES